MNQIEEKWKETIRQKWEGANTGGHNAISTPVMEEILSDIENLLEQERKKYIEEGFQDGIGEFNQKSFSDGVACGIRDERRRVFAALLKDNPMSTKKEKCNHDEFVRGQVGEECLECGLLRSTIDNIGSHSQSESIEWEESLSEYGQLHSEDCCVNFPEDSRACDVDTGVVDCCENMRVIANFVTAEKEKSRKEENDRWVEMAEAHRPHCSATGNKMLTSMMGKKNRISKAITTAVAKEKEKGLAEKKELLKIMTNEKTL